MESTLKFYVGMKEITVGDPRAAAEYMIRWLDETLNNHFEGRLTLEEIGKLVVEEFGQVEEPDIEDLVR
jgi:hypothetical protein